MTRRRNYSSSPSSSSSSSSSSYEPSFCHRRSLLYVDRLPRASALPSCDTGARRPGRSSCSPSPPRPAASVNGRRSSIDGRARDASGRRCLNPAAPDSEPPRRSLLRYRARSVDNGAAAAAAVIQLQPPPQMMMMMMMMVVVMVVGGDDDAANCSTKSDVDAMTATEFSTHTHDHRRRGEPTTEAFLTKARRHKSPHREKISQCATYLVIIPLQYFLATEIFLNTNLYSSYYFLQILTMCRNTRCS